jgi:hypothetical protein
MPQAYIFQYSLISLLVTTIRNSSPRGDHALNSYFEDDITFLGKPTVYERTSFKILASNMLPPKLHHIGFACYLQK